MGAVLERHVPAALTASELTMYKQDGWVVVRDVLPRKLADVIRDHIIHPGLKLHDLALDADDPATWGTGAASKPKLSWFEWLASSLGSETSFYGVRIGFGRGLETGHRVDINAAELELLQKAWTLAQRLAARRFRVVMDQLAGAGTWDDARCCTEDAIGTGLHVRYGLPAKDPSYRKRKHRWPRIGWHIDGAWHLHFLGKQVEEKGDKREKPDIASIAMLAWNDILPFGGMTGVIPRSHKNNFRTIIAGSLRGGISNLKILIWESLFGGAAVDPIAELPDRRVLGAGDALFMHPYLTHSSAWNYQQSLRLGSHMPFKYKEPLDIEHIWQTRHLRDSGPANTELILDSLEEHSAASSVLLLADRIRNSNADDHKSSCGDLYSRVFSTTRFQR